MRIDAAPSSEGITDSPSKPLIHEESVCGQPPLKQRDRIVEFSKLLWLQDCPQYIESTLYVCHTTLLQLPQVALIVTQRSPRWAVSFG